MDELIFAPDLQAFQSMVCVSKAGTQQLFPRSSLMVCLGHSAAISMSVRRYNKFYGRKFWVNTADLQTPLSFFPVHFHFVSPRAGFGRTAGKLNRNIPFWVS